MPLDVEVPVIHPHRVCYMQRRVGQALAHARRTIEPGGDACAKLLERRQVSLSRLLDQQHLAGMAPDPPGLVLEDHDVLLAQPVERFPSSSASSADADLVPQDASSILI